MEWWRKLPFVWRITLIALFCGIVYGGISLLVSKYLLLVIPSNCGKCIAQWFLSIIVMLPLFYLVIRNVYRYSPIERDRFLYAKSGKGVIVYSVMAIMLILCFIWSLSNVWELSSTDIYSSDSGEDNLGWSIIGQFADPGNILQSKNGSGRIIALFSAIAGILCLSGLLVSSLVSMMSKRTQQWRSGMIRYNMWFDDYVVIIGSNEQTAAIIRKSLRDSNVKYVLVQTRKDVEKERSRVELHLERDDEERVVFYYGDRTIDEDINDIKLEKAEEVYILGEEATAENEQDHDAYNVACLELIAEYMREHERKKNYDVRLRCHVNFEYQSTFMAFKFTHIYRNLNEKVEFLPFNVHEIWAKKVLVDNFAIIPTGKHSEKRVQRYLPVNMYREQVNEVWKEKFIRNDSEQFVHIVIMGMNQMGVALAMQAALLVHLPNFHLDNRRRTTITFIDENAVKEGEYLRGRYDALFSLCKHRTIIAEKAQFKMGTEYTDVEDINQEWMDPMKEGNYSFMKRSFMDLRWEFIEGNVSSETIRKYLSIITSDIEHRTTTVAVCFNNPQQSIATALYLPEVVLKRALQILVYQKNSFEMVNKVASTEKEWKRYEKLRPFGMIEGCFNDGIFDNVLARFTNLIYNDENLASRKNKPLTLKPSDLFRAKRLWEELGIVDKYANIDLVDSFEMKLKSLGDNIDEQERAIATAGKPFENITRAEHLRWLTERLTMGYRPLDEKELQKYSSKEANEYRHSKSYYKDKSRAHVDICSNEDIPERDAETAKRNMDSKLIEAILSLKRWSQAVTINQIKTDNSRQDIAQIILDMEKVPGKKIYMTKHVVTVKQWKSIMGYLPKGVSAEDRNAPIVNVSWDNIQDFLTILCKESGLPFDLPCKGEWDDAKKEPKFKEMEGVVWQWTNTKGDEYESSKIFCGRSKKFMADTWSDQTDYSYWLPNFKSEDLGFRLVLRIDFDIEDETDDRDDVDNDDKDVIERMMRKMVLIKNGEKSFRILPTPVTQRQWKAVMYKGEPLKKRENPSDHQGDYLPVENITFGDAVSFCKKMNALGYGGGFRLPNNEEWLYAMKMKGPQTIDAKGNSIITETIWHSGIAKSTHQEPNYKNLKEGKVYDLVGNVWEWVDEPSVYDNGDFTRRMQGGSWRFTEKECKKEDGTYWLKEGYKADDLGFRIVISEYDYQKILPKLKTDEQTSNSVV